MAVPATVSGKRSVHMPLVSLEGTGKAGKRDRSTSQETCRHVAPLKAGLADQKRISVMATISSL